MTFDEFLGARLVSLLRYATVVTCDPHLAEDIVQEVLIRTQQRWARISDVEQPEAYVKRMILNHFLSWRRRRDARALPLPAAAVEAATGAGADCSARVVERHALLGQIAALPPRQRAVIALRYYEDRSDAEIAALLGCSEATVRSHCSQALAALRTSTRLMEASSDHR